MLLGREERLADLILRLFGTEPSCTAKALHQEINKRHRSCSLVAIYKELNKLVRLGILIKVKDRYTVSLSWTLDLLRYTDSLFQNSLRPTAVSALIPLKGEKRSWTFSHLIRMDEFWVQLLFALFEISETRTMYEWVPRLWFPLVDMTRDLQHLRAMQTAQNKFYLVVGGDSYLDKRPLQYWDSEVYIVSHAESSFQHERSRYYCLIDDYILTVAVSKKVAEGIDEIFERVKSEDDLHLQEIYRFFNQPTKTTITLEQNAAKAKSLTRKFKDFWGHR